MIRGLKGRLALFVVLAVVGVTTVSVRYLGIADALLGRGYTVDAVLPGSGGLYAGGDVTVRGVRVGEVGTMVPVADGVRVELLIEDGIRIPANSPVAVHNGSAVGEQYIDFSPTGTGGPYLDDGATVTAGPEALPLEESDLLLRLDEFATSVDTGNLRSVVAELGAMFDDTDRPLGDILESTDQLLDEATAHQDATISLLDTSQTVLSTQDAHAGDVRDFADGMAQVAAALRRSDGSIRTVLADGPAAAQQVDALITDLTPTLPVLLNNISAISRVIAVQLPAVEQLLVTFPVMVSVVFSGITADGYGYAGLQFDDSIPSCTEGYIPTKDWRPGADATDPASHKRYNEVECASDLPINPRGTKWAPRPGGVLPRAVPFDTARSVLSTTDGDIEVLDPVVPKTYDKEEWTWMLLAPTE